MDIFNSQWLVSMLAKSSTTPQGRILSLFDILHDWLNAPNIHLDIEQNTSNQALVVFCTEQAKACGAINPDILAEHIVLIARNATQQQINHPNSGSLIHAKKAAQALILAQTRKDKLVTTPIYIGIAACLFLLMGTAFISLPQLLQKDFYQSHIAQLHVGKPAIIVATHKPDTSLKAADAANMYAKYEQMRNGTCQFPEALQIPDKDKAVYIENVVGGKLPTNLTDLAIANFYLEKVRCNFTPMLMANSK